MSFACAVNMQVSSAVFYFFNTQRLCVASGHCFGNAPSDVGLLSFPVSGCVFHDHVTESCCWGLVTCPLARRCVSAVRDLP